MVGNVTKVTRFNYLSLKEIKLALHVGDGAKTGRIVSKLSAEKIEISI